MFYVNLNARFALFRFVWNYCEILRNFYEILRFAESNAESKKLSSLQTSEASVAIQICRICVVFIRFCDFANSRNDKNHTRFCEIYKIFVRDSAILLTTQI
ncbi:hypothetical protein [Helicobacter sp. 23-1045]